MYQNLIGLMAEDNIAYPIINYRDNVNPNGYPDEWGTLSIGAALALL